MNIVQKPLTVKYVTEGMVAFAYSDFTLQNWVDVMFERDYDVALRAIEKL